MESKMEEIRRLRASKYKQQETSDGQRPASAAGMIATMPQNMHTVSQLTAHLDQHYYLKNQEKPRTVSVSIDADSARIFATPAIGNQLMRFGVMFGRLYPADPLDDLAEAGALPAKQTFRVLVDSIYEPPQTSASDSVTIGGIPDPDRERIDTVATALGLRVVGFAVTHSFVTLPDGSRGPPDYVLSGAEAALLAHYQTLYGAHCVEVVTTIADDGTSAFAAYQVSDQACLLYADGVLAPAAGIAGGLELTVRPQLQLEEGAVPSKVFEVAASQRLELDKERKEVAAAAESSKVKAFSGSGATLAKKRNGAEGGVSASGVVDVDDEDDVVCVGERRGGGGGAGKAQGSPTDPAVAAVGTLDGEDIRGLLVSSRDLVHTTTAGKRERVRRIPTVRFMLATAISPLEANEAVIRSRFVRLNRFEPVTLSEATNYIKGRPAREPFAVTLNDFHFLAFLAHENLVGTAEASLIASALAVAQGWAVERPTAALSVAPPTKCQSLSESSSTQVHTAVVLAGCEIPPVVEGVPRATAEGASQDAASTAAMMLEGVELVIKGSCGIN